MVLNLMERAGDPVAAMAELLERVHEPEAQRRRHVRRALEIYLSLRTAGVLTHVSSAQAAADGHPRLRLAVDLPADFALNQPLAPFALAAMDLLKVEAPEHTVDVVSVVEATLDDPRPLLYAQQRAARGEAIAAMTFSDLISRYELGRSEGVVLRYLTDAYRALRQVVPEEHRTPEVVELIDWLGALVRAVDSSLLDEWEALGQAQAGKAGEAAGLLEGDRPGADDSSGVERAFGADEDGTVAFTRNRHAFRVAVRREMFRRVELMARDDVEALGRLDASSGWGEDRWPLLGRVRLDRHRHLGSGDLAGAARRGPR